MNKKQKSLTNKDFSLVELIIVIAIMAVLIGVLAPQYIKYLDKSKISADTQLADSVRNAITNTLLDPSVTDNVPAENTAKTTIPGPGATATDFWKNVYDVLGETSYNDLLANLKYDNDNTKVVISYEVDGQKNVTVTIDGGKYTTNSNVITYD